jgi:hypothetical protein
MSSGVGGGICSEINGGKLVIKENSLFTGSNSGATGGGI